MAKNSKNLETSLIINTSTSERNLSRLLKRLQDVQNAFSNQTSKLDAIDSKIKKNKNSTDQWAKSVDKVKNNTSRLSSVANYLSHGFDNATSSVRKLAAAYLGVMSARSGLTASDTITSAENKLNYINNGDTNTTTAQMDRMYSAAQRARMGYGDMISNIGKSMTLAGDAFDNNIDMAIRFQEVMGKSYTLAGASAAEMSSSMYQLIQGLGSGVLQGDELRSVREGAPLAYKEIEKFAQGVYNTEESLKDLASQGKITSDIVVAAMLHAGDSIDSAFAKTNITLGQVWTQIKNKALDAFRAIQDKINSFINSKTGQKMVYNIYVAIEKLGIALGVILDGAIAFATYVTENWDEISPIIYGMIGAMITFGIVSAASWMIANLPALVFIGTISAVIKAFINMNDGATLTCQSIGTLFMMLGLAALVLGAVIIAVIVAVSIAAGIASAGITLIISAIVMLILGAILLVGGYILKHLRKTLAQYYWWQANLNNIVARIKAGWAGMCAYCSTEWENFMLWTEVVGDALDKYMKALGNNIQVAMSNPWEYAKAAFWNFVADLWSGMKGLEPALNSLATLFGMGGFSITDYADFARSQANAINTETGYINLGSIISDASAKYKSGKQNPVDAAQNAFNQVYKDEYTDPDQAYKQGWALGGAIERKFNKWIDDAQSKIEELVKQVEEYDPEAMKKEMEELLKEAEGLANSIDDNTGTTAGNTGDIADSMDLAEEDLKYLREIAEMEWKKEFTTASITVDMSNYNSINGDADLDGIVTKLTDKLYEELDSVANGVYAY